MMAFFNTIDPCQPLNRPSSHLDSGHFAMATADRYAPVVRHVVIECLILKSIIHGSTQHVGLAGQLGV